jgi:integrase
MHLTDTLCKKIQPPAKSSKISYDGGPDSVTGFGLRVTAGGAKSFILNYRRRSDGCERRLTIGAFPTWTTGAARVEAKRLKRDIDLGADPLAELEKLRGEPTLAEVAERDWSAIKTKRRASTLRTWRNQLDADILPMLGSRKIGSITEADIATLHKAITDRGAPVAANRTVWTLSGILRRAKVEPNPCALFVENHALNREQARERFVSQSETARLLTALDHETDRQAVNILKLIWLTGARAGEAMQSRWADFDLDEGRWKKPRATTKGDIDHRVPLSAAAVSLLRALYQHRDQTSPYLFPAINKKGEATHRTRINRPRERILQAAGISDLRTHDLRHSFATTVHDAGTPLAVVGKLLGHRDLRSTQRYAHATQRAMRAAVEHAANALGASAKIIPLK